LALERSRAAESEKQALATYYRMLQAQIEPHFLFNTLANIAGLIDADPRTAKHMLERFVAYLRSTLSASRAERTTLGREAELVRAYLDVISVRMGTRLRYRVEIPKELSTIAMPAMLIQPLVENAIKHGLEPKLDGGEIVVAAHGSADMLIVGICDTGLGFDTQAGASGVGLANVRERLAALYDGRATLDVEDNEPCGARVTLHLPLGSN